MLVGQTAGVGARNVGRANSWGREAGKFVG